MIACHLTTPASLLEHTWQITTGMTILYESMIESYSTNSLHCHTGRVSPIRDAGHFVYVWLSEPTMGQLYVMMDVVSTDIFFTER